MFFFVFLIFLFYFQNTFCQIIVEKSKYNFTNRIVSFEYITESFLDSLDNDVFKYKPFATGFFIKYNNGYFLITCKHVIYTIITNYLGELIIRYPYYDKINDEVKTFRFSTNIKDKINNSILFSNDSCYDICVIDYGDILSTSYFYNFLIDTNKTDYQFSFYPQSQIINYNDTIFEMDNVYFSGYPFGLSGNSRNYLIYRTGIIAAIINDIYESPVHETICGKHYLINSESYGGDSGSPVFITSLRTTGTISDVKLIGILRGAYFTGVSIVEPIDEVIKIISEYQKRKIR